MLQMICGLWYLPTVSEYLKPTSASWSSVFSPYSDSWFHQPEVIIIFFFLFYSQIHFKYRTFSEKSLWISETLTGIWICECLCLWTNILIFYSISNLNQTMTELQITTMQKEEDDDILNSILIMSPGSFISCLFYSSYIQCIV